MTHTFILIIWPQRAFKLEQADVKTHTSAYLRTESQSCTQEEEVGIQYECRRVKDQISIVNWIEGKTIEAISKAQDQDPCIGIIKKWKISSEIRPRLKHISHQIE